MGEVEKSCSEDTYGLIQLKPVGVVRNNSHEASWDKIYQDMTWQERAARMKAQSQSVSELIIAPELEGILDGIDEFSHLMVIYWPHLIPEEKRWVLKTYPLGSKDFPLVGTFATHSPARPNSILVTVVRLLGHFGNILKVTDLDALDGSPILDIKPYIPYHQTIKDVNMPDWMRKMHNNFKQSQVETVA